MMRGYLCQPWTFNPEESFNNAVRWARGLYQRGWSIFSPILHTHHFWKTLQKEAPKFKADYLSWDINLLEGLDRTHNWYMIISETALREDMRWKLMDHQDMKFYVDQTPLWVSEGCRIECKWAIEHEMPIVHLESILQNPLGTNLIMRFLHRPI